VTIFEALTWGEQELKRAFSQAPSYHQPKIDAQLLLAFCLKKPTAFLFSHFTDPVSDTDLDAFRAVIARRSAMEPAAYIIGKKAFYGRDFQVTAHTLIPRPDTELLVDDVLKHLTPKPLLIDVGTGSGAIGISVALESGAPVVCIDNSSEALKVARENARLLEAESLTHFLTGHLLDPLFDGEETYLDFDSTIVMANLPYLSQAQYDALEPGVKQFEPESALVSGADGLDHYRELLEQLVHYRRMLPKNLRVYCEIDSTQRRAMIALAQQFEATHFEIQKDLERRDRLAVLCWT
jgi:release factor glutamine methyltransferase